MIAEYDVSMKADSSSSNRNTILEDGLAGTSLAPAVNVMTCSRLYDAAVCCHSITLHAKWPVIDTHKESSSRCTLSNAKGCRAWTALRAYFLCVPTSYRSAKGVKIAGRIVFIV